MSAPVSGTITAAGVAGAVVNALQTPDTQLLLEISGAYPAGTTLVFEALPVGGQNWFPVAGVQQDLQAIVIGSQATPLLLATAGLNLGFKFDLSGCQAFRVWAPALPSGSLTVQETSGSFFSAAPLSGAALSLNYALTLAVLWQLQHLTFLLASSDEKLSALFTQNPILPSNLLPATWDVTG